MNYLELLRHWHFTCKNYHAPGASDNCCFCDDREECEKLFNLLSGLEKLFEQTLAQNGVLKKE